jgi:hypothetical protein
MEGDPVILKFAGIDLQVLVARQNGGIVLT